MNQGRKVVALCVALALASAVAALPAHAARAKTTSSTTAKAKPALHQFTGIVTAMDKTSITVEKGGKTPRTMVFTRDAAMRTVGDVGKDARVTVYYRGDERDAQAVRVVVKPVRASER